MLASVHGSREETCCGETNMPKSSVPSESKHRQRLPAQQKQQMREVIQHLVLRVAQATYSGTDTYTEYTHVHVLRDHLFHGLLQKRHLIFCAKPSAE